MKRLLILEAAFLSYLGLIALMPYIPIAVSLFFSLIYLVLLIGSRENEVILHNRIASVFAILFSILFIGQALGGESVKSIVYLLLTLNALKLAGEKRSGDLLQILLLNFLIVASVTTFTIEPSFLFLLLAFIGVSINFLVNLTTHELFEKEVQKVGELAKLSGKIFFVSIPLAILFFFILPRSGTSYFPSTGKSITRVGFTDRIDIGNMEKLLRSNKIAFRAKIIRGKMPILPYWRGTTYEIFRKGSWFHRREAVGTFPLNLERVLSVPIRGKYVVQEITLEGNTYGFLPGLQWPIGGKFPFRVFVSRSLVFRSGVPGRVKYRMISVESKSLPDEPPDENYTYVPPYLADTLRILFRSFKDTPEKMAIKLTHYFRTRFKYSLSFKAPENEDPIIYFLTEKRSGHCEMFASAMALILRSFGIPTRLVGGYLGATYNKLGDYYVVYEGDAHTWVEVYLPETGWVKFDPSPPSQRRRSNISRLFLYIDYMKLLWYNNVINYDLFSQLGAVESVSYSAKNLKFPKKWILLSILFALLVFKRRKRKHFYIEALRILENKGIKRNPWETPGEFAIRVRKLNGEVGGILEDLTNLYYEAEYGGKEMSKSPAALLDQLKKSSKSLRTRKYRFFSS